MSKIYFFNYILSNIIFIIIVIKIPELYLTKSNTIIKIVTSHLNRIIY